MFAFGKTGIQICELEGPSGITSLTPSFMDEEVGTQEPGSALFRALARQTKMRIHIKHADIKFYMLKKKKKTCFLQTSCFSEK